MGQAILSRQGHNSASLAMFVDTFQTLSAFEKLNSLELKRIYSNTLETISTPTHSIELVEDIAEYNLPRLIIN